MIQSPKDDEIAGLCQIKGIAGLLIQHVAFDGAIAQQHHLGFKLMPARFDCRQFKLQPHSLIGEFAHAFDAMPPRPGVVGEVGNQRQAERGNDKTPKAGISFVTCRQILQPLYALLRDC